MNPNPRRTQENGSTSIELAVLTPVLLLLLALIIAGARIVSGHAAINTATMNAARAASLARSPAAAETAATSIGHQALEQRGLHCDPGRLHSDTSGFRAPIGQAGHVTVAASCQVPLSSLLAPGFPGHVPLHAMFTSSVDPFRESS